MIVTFRSKAHADIVLFGDIAVKLLKLMGHSGTVPSALLAGAVPAALDHLKKPLPSIRPQCRGYRTVLKTTARASAPSIWRIAPYL